jgi:hypothetical protein
VVALRWRTVVVQSVALDGWEVQAEAVMGGGCRAVTSGGFVHLCPGVTAGCHAAGSASENAGLKARSVSRAALPEVACWEVVYGLLPDPGVWPGVGVSVWG